MNLKSDFEESLGAPDVGQHWLHSFYEACFGTVVGFLISWALQYWVISPLFNLRTSGGEDFIIVSIFTVASVLRSFGVRRFFNWLHKKRNGK